MATRRNTRRASTRGGEETPILRYKNLKTQLERDGSSWIMDVIGRRCMAWALMLTKEASWSKAGVLKGVRAVKSSSGGEKLAQRVGRHMKKTTAYESWYTVA